MRKDSRMSMLIHTHHSHRERERERERSGVEGRERRLTKVTVHLSSDDHGVVSRDIGLLRRRLFSCSLLQCFSLTACLLQCLITKQLLAFLKVTTDILYKNRYKHLIAYQYVHGTSPA